MNERTASVAQKSVQVSMVMRGPRGWATLSQRSDGQRGVKLGAKFIQISGTHNAGFEEPLAQRAGCIASRKKRHVGVEKMAETKELVEHLGVGFAITQAERDRLRAGLPGRG